MNLTLIGMPAAGKSTIGVILAKTLGMHFVDTDILIQEKEGELLQNIIDKKGNDYYLTGKWENPGTSEIENVKSKLKVYKKIFLKSENGDIFAYDIKKNTLALMGAEVAPPPGVDPEFEVFIYFRKGSKK